LRIEIFISLLTTKYSLLEKRSLTYWKIRIRET
jgi:hypothetical protein